MLVGFADGVVRVLDLSMKKVEYLKKEVSVVFKVSEVSEVIEVSAVSEFVSI